MKNLILTILFTLAFALNAQAQDKPAVPVKNKTSAQTNADEPKYRALMKKGNEYLSEGNFGEAIETFNAALAYNIEPNKTLYYRGFSYYMSMQYENAMADMNTIIARGGEAVASAYFIRGTTKLAMEDTEGACADLKKAKELGHDVTWEAYMEMCGK